jgi:hypothetical protein
MIRLLGRVTTPLLPTFYLRLLIIPRCPVSKARSRNYKVSGVAIRLNEIEREDDAGEVPSAEDFPARL